MKQILWNALGLGLALFAAVACASTSSSEPTSDSGSAVSEASEAEEIEQPEKPIIVVAEFSSVQTDPILARGKEGEWDSIVMRFPYVVQHDGGYHMFYEARAVQGESFVAIGYATSEDGISWTKFEGNPILEGDGSGFDSLVVGRPVVSINEEGMWVMYYAGSSETEESGVGRAIASSPTGAWTRDEEPLLSKGPPGAWDNEFLVLDQIVTVEDEQRIYYSGRPASSQSSMIGLAISTDGGAWEKFNDPTNDSSEPRFAESDPILLNGPGWDSRATWTPNIWMSDGGWVMMYNASGNLGLAFSDDGIHWSKYAENPVISNGSLFHPFVVHNDDGTMLIYYRSLRDDALHLLEGTLSFE